MDRRGMVEVDATNDPFLAGYGAQQRGIPFKHPDRKYRQKEDAELWKMGWQQAQVDDNERRDSAVDIRIRMDLYCPHRVRQGLVIYSG